MFCFDSNYVIPASVAFYSLLQKTALGGGGGVKLKLFVIHHNISSQNQAKLQKTIEPFSHFASLDFIDAKEDFKDFYNQLQSKNHFSSAMFYKLIAPGLFPQYDKIIISDVDVCFLGNVAPSFLDFDEHSKDLIAGVVSNDPDLFFPIPKRGWKSGYKKFSQNELQAIQHGVGAGYLIINLKQWRNENLQEKAMNFLKDNANRLVLPEQDILNIISYPHIKRLSLAHLVGHDFWKTYGDSWEKLSPKIYTQDEIDQARESPIQIHYVGADKPWNTPSTPKSDLWFSILCQTPFLQDYLWNLESIMLQKWRKNQFLTKVYRVIKENPSLIFKLNSYQKIVEMIKNKIFFT